jgi:hypothetical protein
VRWFQAHQKAPHHAGTQQTVHELCALFRQEVANLRKSFAARVGTVQVPPPPWLPWLLA